MQPKLSVPEGEHLVGDTVFQKRLAVRHRRPNSYRIQKKAVHILEVVIAAGGLAALRDEVQGNPLILSRYTLPHRGTTPEK